MHVPDQTNQRQLSRRTYKVVIAGSLLVVASVAGFNAAMVIGFAAVPLALFTFVSGAKKWDGYTRKSIYQRAGLMAIGAILLVSAPVSCSIQSRLLELRLQPVITALKAYRDINDRYPQSLDELVPDYLTSAVPTCPNRRPISFSQNNAETAQFELTCVTFGFNKHTYDSAAGAWKDWD